MNIFDMVLPPREVNNGTPGYLGIGKRKRLSASARRPGNHTANHEPSCTAKQAKHWDRPGEGKRAHR